KIVTLNLVADDDLLDRRNEIKMSTDDPPDQARLREAIKPSAVERVALTDAEEQRQVARLAEIRRVRVARLVNLAELMNHLLGDADTTESADGDRIAGTDQPHRLACRNNLASFTRTRCRNNCGGAHGSLSLVALCGLCLSVQFDARFGSPPTAPPMQPLWCSGRAH